MKPALNPINDPRVLEVGRTFSAPREHTPSTENLTLLIGIRPTIG